ncbi:MAG TPA: hypothetical protein VKV28_17545 [Candidatus Binataceae bacterium]|nr:hypothetical protein [Candidatus Binataceae bacterium]
MSFNPANCPTGAGADPTYVVASGGSTGVGSNSAIGLIALTGPCNGLTAASFVVVNELTTVAAEWALARFTDSTGTVVGTSSTNATGISNAVTLATEDLVVSYMSSGGNSGNTGIPAAFWANTGATVASCSSGSPAVNCDGLERLDTLANILASCINTNGPSSPQCSALLGAAGATTTTLAAAHAIASSPARNVAAIFAITPPAGMSLFQPALAASPAAFTIALNYLGGGLNYPDAVAIDAAGDAWVVNEHGGSGGNTLTELNPLGTPISPSTGFTGGGLNGPQAIALDIAGNAWVSNNGGNSVSEFNSAGTPLSPSVGYTGGGINAPLGIAIDASGHVWIANNGVSGSVSELMGGNTPPASCPSPPSTGDTGCPISPATGFTGGGLSSSFGLTIDGSLALWISNQISPATLSKFTSSGSPVSGSPFSGGGLNGPQFLALDAASNVWVANGGSVSSPSTTVSEFSSSGVPISPGGGYDTGLNSPYAVAIDSSGEAWLTHGGVSLIELVGGNTPPASCPSAPGPTDTGCSLSPSGGFTGPGMGATLGLAIDASGDVWVTNEAGAAGTFGGVTEFIGVAGPVLTPNVACLQQGSTVCLP